MAPIMWRRTGNQAQPRIYAESKRVILRTRNQSQVDSGNCAILCKHVAKPPGDQKGQLTHLTIFNQDQSRNTYAVASLILTIC